MSFVETSEPIITDEARQQLHSDVSLAAEAVALNWPLRTFISRNPLAGFEHLPFHKAVARANSLLGGEGYLSLAKYRACWAQGRILREDLESALKELGPRTVLETSLALGLRRIRADEVLVLHLIHGIDAIDAQTISWKLSNEQTLTRFQPEVPSAIWTHLLADSHGAQSEARVLTALWEAIDAKLTLPSGNVTRGRTCFHQPDQPPLPTVADHAPQSQRGWMKEKAPCL